MKIVIGADHAGFKEKEELMSLLDKEGISTIDMGLYDKDPIDYPLVASHTVTGYKIGGIDFGVLLCGTGIGMSMAANSYGVRAARCCCMEDVKMAREHNDAEFLCLGVRQGLTVNDLKEMIVEFVNHEFSGDERHVRRIELINKRV